MVFVCPKTNLLLDTPKLPLCCFQHKACFRSIIARVKWTSRSGPTDLCCWAVLLMRDGEDFEMTKLVPLRTIEHGLRRALATLGDGGAQKAIQDVLGIKRSASLLRKCADPDDDRHHIQFRYGVALDVACEQAGQLPPLLEVHLYLIERHSGVDSLAPARGAEAVVLHAVLSLQAALGDLSESVSGALHAGSPGGVKLTNREKHEIHEALDAIHNQAETIKRMMAE